MTKRRILEFIKNQNITIPIFFQKTGIKRGFLDSDKLDQAVSDRHFSMIIAAFPDLSVDWLITGEGPMLRNNIVQSIEGDHNIQTAGNGNIMVSNKELDDKISFLEDKVLFLTEQLKEKDNQINTLLSIIQNNSKH